MQHIKFENIQGFLRAATSREHFHDNISQYSVMQIIWHVQKELQFQWSNIIFRQFYLIKSHIKQT